MTEYFEIRDDKIFLLSREKFLDMTISEIIRGSYIVKHDRDGKTVRYVSDDQAYAKSLPRGDVKWLHELLAELGAGTDMNSAEALNSKLSSVLSRTTVKMVKEVFPGAVEVGAIQIPEQKQKSAQMSLIA